MLRRLLAAVLSAGIVLGGAAPAVASESITAVGTAALDGKKKAKTAKKGKKKADKKAKKKAAKKKASKKPTKKAKKPA